GALPRCAAGGDPGGGDGTGTSLDRTGEDPQAVALGPACAAGEAGREGGVPVAGVTLLRRVRLVDGDRVRPGQLVVDRTALRLRYQLLAVEQADTSVLVTHHRQLHVESRRSTQRHLGRSVEETSQGPGHPASVPRGRRAAEAVPHHQRL